MSTDIFMERLWPQPQTDADMQTMMEAMGCLNIHRITWCGSLLSADGREMFCHFRGPDAESLRIVMRSMPLPPGRIWACTVQDTRPELGAAELARANVIVGHEFDSPADYAARELSEKVNMGCFQLHRVRRVRSYLSTDRLRMFSLYEAPDAESVRVVQRQAELPPDRVWAVRRFSPP
ncbi:MAG TPA: nickel-binding protein [Rhizobacter sp.]|nr:nickel-binding protein [Rhizobacter sp.]